MSAALAAKLRAALDDVLAPGALAARVEAEARELFEGAQASAVLAVGKAAPSMLRGAAAAGLVPRGAGRVLVVVPEGVPVGRLPRGARVLRASHPLPDARSVGAARAATRLFASAPSGPRLALVSGGSSSVLAWPLPGTSLAQKRAIVRAALASGAPIELVNLVRRHLSRVKGGGLLRAAAGQPVVTLVARDVVGGAPRDVGSGPTVPDGSTVAEARAAARAMGLPPRLVLGATLAPTGPAVRAARVREVASPEAAARALVQALRHAGLAARLLPASGASAERLARSYVRLAARLAPGEAIVRAAEPTVELPRARARAAGRGGRSSHLAALVAPALGPGLFALFAASDGADGAGGGAGVLLDGARPHDPAALATALAAFDTGAYFARRGELLPRHPTGHNVCDLHVIARAPSRR